MKNLFVGFLILWSASSFAQVRSGVFAGPQITSVRYTIDNVKQSAEAKFGVQAGATLKVPFENRLYFAPALYYSMKGYTVTLNKPSFPPAKSAINNSTRIHTAEIAALLQYNFSASPSHFFIKGGPAFDIAVFGTEKFDTTGGSVKRNMKFSFADYGRITASLNVHIGFEAATGLFLFAHYAHGIGSLNNADGGPRIVHRCAGISLGYYLNRRQNGRKE